MSDARFLVGDVRDVLDTLTGPYDLALCSPPFLALRSYLPDDHAEKAREIGSEPTPAAYLDTLLELTAAWGGLLAPHGSIAIELGDTYAGSGGAGGDYDAGGLRAGQPKFRQGTPRWDGRPAGQVRTTTSDPVSYPPRARDGWPLDKSLCAIPALYQVALTYGLNPLTGEPSPAGRWRVRNLKPWIRSNPPVGALGDKERPATSYVIVATRARDRYFDLDAVRSANDRVAEAHRVTERNAHAGRPCGGDLTSLGEPKTQNEAGAPPRDWWHHVDAVLDAELAERAGRYNGGENPSGAPTGQPNGGQGRYSEGVRSVGAQGVHLRRALERAGILRTLDAHDVSPKGYAGAHYAVWPPELVRLLVNEMCPRWVCTTCGQPSRWLTERHRMVDGVEVAAGTPYKTASRHPSMRVGTTADERAEWVEKYHDGAGGATLGVRVETLGWSDCGHGTWRPGRVLDPFVGSGTTLAVCTGMGRQADGIDLDPRNAELARGRVGMFLDIERPQA